MPDVMPPEHPTIRSIVADRRLGLSIVVAPPELLDRTIVWAHVVEVVDPRPHVRADELVCTVGAALVDPPEAVRFVDAVKEAGCVGICLGLGEVHTEVPAALERACRSRGVVLLAMAHGVPFRAISDMLSVSRLRDPALSDLVAECMELLRAGAPLDDMFHLAAGRLGGRFDIVPHADVAEGQPDRASLPSQRIDVELNDAERLRWAGDDAIPSRSMVEGFARVVSIARRGQLAQEAENRRRVGQLLSLIVEGLAHSASLLPDLERVGLKGERVVVSAWPEGTGALASRLHPDALVAEMQEVVLLLSKDSKHTRESSIRSQLVTGYSNAVGLADVAHGIAEARATLMLARRRGTIAGPETLSTLAALLEQQPRSRLAPFVSQLIEPLLQHGGKSGLDLLSTVRIFIDQHGSVTATAATQFLHVNTVRHRLARVREIAGRDPFVDSDRADLRIALWAYDRFARRHDSKRG